MKKNIFLISFLVLIVALLSVSCQPEPKTSNLTIPQLYQGKWVTCSGSTAGYMFLEIESNHIWGYAKGYEDRASDMSYCNIPGAKETVGTNSYRQECNGGYVSLQYDPSTGILTYKMSASGMMYTYQLKRV